MTNPPPESSNTVKNKKIKVTQIIAFMLFFCGLLAVMGAYLEYTFNDNIARYDKKNTIEDVSLIIKNGGDLKAVKHAISNQDPLNKYLYLFHRVAYYSANHSISFVLEDIRVQILIDSSQETQAILPKLNSIIKDHLEISPFDNLSSGQKDFFENIRIKTGENYHMISNDVNNLAVELHQKNLLVKEYLADSKKSFVISIVALIFSVLIGGFQIYNSRSAALREVFLSSLTEDDKEEA